MQKLDNDFYYFHLLTRFYLHPRYDRSSGNVNLFHINYKNFFEMHYIVLNAVSVLNTIVPFGKPVDIVSYHLNYLYQIYWDLKRHIKYDNLQCDEFQESLLTQYFVALTVILKDYTIFLQQRGLHVTINKWYYKDRAIVRVDIRRRWRYFIPLVLEGTLVAFQDISYCQNAVESLEVAYKYVLKQKILKYKNFIRNCYSGIS